MKTKLLAFILICIFSLTYASADNNKKIDKKEQTQVTRTINKEIKYPSFAIENNIQGEVYVNFIVNNDGSIKVQKVNSGQQELKEYVVTEMKKIHLTPDESIVNRNYNMKFTFKLL